MRNNKLVSIYLSCPLIACFTFEKVTEPWLVDSTWQQNANSIHLQSLKQSTINEKEVLSLTLEEAVEMAIKRNPQIQVAQQQLLEAEEGLKATSRSYFPTLSLSSYLQISDQLISDPKTGVSIDIIGNDEFNTTLSGSIELNYNVYTGGLRTGQLQIAKAQLESATLEIEITTLEVELAVIQAYYQLQAAEQDLKIASQAVVNSETTLRDTQALAQARMVTQPDVAQAELNLANYRQHLNQALNNRLVALSQLTQVLNLPANLEIQASSSVEKAGKWDLSLEESISLAWQQRPELKQQLTQVETAKANRQVSLAQIRPNISLNSEMTASRLYISESFNGSTLNQTGIEIDTSITAQITWEFFDGGIARAQARQAEAQMNAASRQLDVIRSQIQQEVEEAFTQLQYNQKNVELASSVLDLAMQTLKSRRIQFQAGVIDINTLISAEIALNQAEENFNNAIIGYNLALASIRNATNTRLTPIDNK
ncbi:MAG: TolC family protein [Gloeocapsa sp. DLM2.Bin57]|nr:MAG: TolC family protein [Gloeocapsa sp. DLM2.Bin57]